ncbi:MAG TPA: hypothetical protein VJQ57_13105 [Acidimicrobiia bacterium]|nr:hypothetical protein [Acidimicrobiia bacterium]
MAKWLGRLVGLGFGLLGIWVLAINLIERGYEGATLALILASGLAGAVGGALFLLSIDGPQVFRSRPVRLTGWVGMLVLAATPTSISFLLLLLVLLAIPMALQRSGPSAV